MLSLEKKKKKKLPESNGYEFKKYQYTLQSASLQLYITSITDYRQDMTIT